MPAAHPFAPAPFDAAALPPAVPGRVSVVVVCYNDLPHLELALDSALGQTYQALAGPAALEVIVVDNGSADGTPELVAGRYGDRVRCVRQSNVGAAGGRNTGLLLATGEFVQFLDGDDLLAPNKVEKQVRFLQENPHVGVAVGRSRSFDSEPGPRSAAWRDDDTPPPADARAAFIAHGTAPPICMLTRRTAVERVGLQDEQLFLEDHEYWLRMAFAGVLFGDTPEAYSFYRRRAGQKTQRRWRMELGEYAVLSRARRYVTEEPFRAMLDRRLLEQQATFLHYLLHHGMARPAAKLLARLERLAGGAAPGVSRLTRLLARMPAGDRAYRLLRRLRGLPAPFSAFSGPRPAAA